MKYIKDYKEGDRVFDIYLCKHKQSAVTKNGKSYDNVILQDKTGTIDAKVWDPNNPGIGDFDTLDYLPVSSKDIGEMFRELLGIVESIGNPYYKKLLRAFFAEDAEFARKFQASSAAKRIHHGFVGGLLEHTLSVTKMCDYLCTAYPVLKRDLLLTAAICHDMGKVREISLFPENDYTDDGQLLGHIVMGAQMVAERAAGIEGFPHHLLTQLQHCILAHQGKLEFGSPKVPALMEALALYHADDTDAKLETYKEILESAGENNQDWLGYNRLFESNLRATRLE